MQWVVLRMAGYHPPQPWTAFPPGVCILGAAFLLAWAAEAAEMDLPQNVSIGILALIAVLPEYAVDIYFAWSAGQDPSYTSYATANMTGANRLLIGLGWPAVLLACWWGRGMREIRLSENNALELVTLLLATLYSFFLPFKANLSVFDSAVFMALFAFYAYCSSRAPVEEPELEGPALLIANLPKTSRRLAVGALFLFSALAIFLSAEPFAEGILEAGRHLGIEEFLLVQWLAPLASESPEFIIAILLALKGKPAVGLRALVSSKVNQWTLLVGTLPAAYSLSAASLSPMPLDARQVEEIFLTSAQSLFGMVVLMNLRFSLAEALSLLVLFAAQLFFPQASVRYFFAGLYLLISLALILQGARRASISGLFSKVLKS
ncbi:MAG: sodium:proton exchanger [Elusimicrobia bacterium RIFCSPHIGHO2_02_FULL_57_9]|nr:MAG: sodium:proton exchanger [Elusimicrobia bacterium RIFCSPHIGHO2_02_FULL_57_9]